MDTTVLTTAWLDAVYRARSATYQHYVQQVPQAKAPRTDRTLSDTILSALQDDGVKPQQTVDPVESPAEADATADQHVDRLA